MQYNGFEVDPAFIKNGSVKWRFTGNGEYVIGTKDGKKYFIKRNMHVRLPDKSEPKEVYNKNKIAADTIQKKQEKLRSLMKGFNWHTDHIVAEEENFWDLERMFVTIMPCVPGALSEDYDYTALSEKELLNLALKTAEAFDKLHACGVIHGDVKDKNILVTKNSGVYTPYLVDFDASYPALEVPDRDPESEEFGGSAGYQSPEILAYGRGLVEKSAITPATDIFSLGITIHKWWTGAFPSIDAEYGSVGSAVYQDKAVTINKKFNVRIGTECGATLLSLINWMFAKKPEDRPTARQVADVLSDKLEVPEIYHKGSDRKPFDTKLWDAHNAIAELLTVAELKKLGVKSFKRINEGGGSMSLKYRVAVRGGGEKVMTIAELREAGYVKGKEAEIDDPWEEHMIEFSPAAEIAAKGYAQIKRARTLFRKRYLVTTASGREIDKGYDWLISAGLAHLKHVEVVADTPWPEHGEQYNIENMAKLGVKTILRMEVGGEHRYRLEYNEIVDGKNKTNERVPANNLKLMGLIK